MIIIETHGIEASDRGLYLAVNDTKPDDLEDTAIRSDHLRQIVGSVRCATQVIVDCSYSGVLAKQAWSPEVAVLTSCGAHEQAVVHQDGSFFDVLAQGVNDASADLDRDGFIDVNELHLYATRRLGEMGWPQRPMLAMGSDARRFAFLAPLGVKPAGPVGLPVPSLPAPLRAEFVGREKELRRLRDSLLQARSVRMFGPPGAGKSSLARMAFQDSEVRKRFPRGVFYGRCQGEDGQTALEYLLALLVPPALKQAPLEERIRVCTEDLNALLVIDDLDDAVPRHLVDAIDASCVLLTIGRMKLPVDAGGVAISLGTLSNNDARSLLTTLDVRDPKRQNSILSNGPHTPLMIRLLAGEASFLEGATSGESPSLQGVLHNLYEELSPEAARVFRRLHVLGSAGADVEALSILAPEADGRTVLNELESKGIVTTSAEGNSVFIHDLIAAFSKKVFEVDEDQAQRLTVEASVHRWTTLRSHHQPEPRLSRDLWTIEDSLQFSPYADAISSFIRHPGTRPPLTVGVKGAWGAGKTSLMRMVQQRLDPPLDAAGTRCAVQLRRQGSKEAKASWLQRLFRRKSQDLEGVRNFEVLAAAAAGERGRLSTSVLDTEVQRNLPGGLERDWRATVWFNPWMYQSGEQVWAGLVHEIINQVTGRLSKIDRERFWLHLNLSRTDSNAVRRRVYSNLWTRLVPSFSVFLSAALVSLVLLGYQQVVGAAWLGKAGAIFFGLGGLASAVSAVKAVLTFLQGPASTAVGDLLSAPDLARRTRNAVSDELRASYDEVVRNPGYESRVGFLHMMQADIPKVLRLVADEGRPLVVFVDDLDRCTSATTSQVVEAINLFLAGEFPNCIFVIAMEPAVVAAHVEAAYKDLAAMMREGDRRSGASVGWRFLDKIVQLPLSIPAPKGHQRSQDYLRSLLEVASDASPQRALSSEVSEEDGSSTFRSVLDGDVGQGGSAFKFSQVESVPLAPSEAEILDFVARIRERRPTVTTLPEIVRRVQAEKLGNDSPEELIPAAVKAAERVFAELYSDSDALIAIETALPALGAINPREVKRYVNVYRFYTFIAQRQRLMGVSAPPSGSVAKFAAFVVRWPHLLGELGAMGESGSSLQSLETSARATSGDDDSWRSALEQAGLLSRTSLEMPGWAKELRVFLSSGASVGEAAGRFL